MEQVHLNELDILTALYYHSKNFHAYVLRLKPEFFAEEYQAYYDVFQQYYKSYGQSPHKTVFEAELTSEESKPTLQLLDRIIANYERIKDLSHEYISDKIQYFAKGCYLKQFLLDSYDLYEQGQYDKIIRKISSLTESVIDNDVGKEYHDKEFIDYRYSDSNYNSYIKTGFTQFDETFGGWYNKALHVIAGPSNSGKTMWLVNMVSNLLLNEVQTGLKVLYITLEIDEAQIGRRLDASLLDVPMTELHQYKDVNLQEMIYESKATRGNRLIIKEMQAYKTTPSDIDALIRNLDVTSNGELKPDVVIVDYLGLLSPTNMNSRMGLYEKGLAISVELRALAQMYEIPFLVAAQTNRQSFADRVDQDKISDSIGIAQTCDLLMTVNRNEDMDKDDQVVIFLAKSRFCKNGQTFTFHVNYDNMRVEDMMGGVSTANSDNTTEKSE
jgi:replicative DNA helicase